MTRLDFICARALAGYYDLPHVREIIAEELIRASGFNSGNGKRGNLGASESP